VQKETSKLVVLLIKVSGKGVYGNPVQRAIGQGG